MVRELSDSSLSAEVVHPRRGRLSGFEVLVIALRHAAEHMGQAELTRELVLARRTCLPNSGGTADRRRDAV
jgi:hypothetical protein